MGDREDQITLAVIATELKHTNRSLDSLTTELRQQRETSDRRFGEFEEKLAGKADIERVSKIENWLGWGVKIVLTAVFVAVLGLVIIKSGPGVLAAMTAPPAVIVPLK